MFSTLTPFFVFKVGVGAAAKSGYWVGPFSPRSPLFFPPCFLCCGW